MFKPAFCLCLFVASFPALAQYRNGFGVELRPGILILPDYLQSTSLLLSPTLTQTFRTPNKTFYLFSGTIAPELYWKRFAIRGGPVFTYPVYPTRDTATLTTSQFSIGMERNLIISGFGELQFNLTRSISVIAGYSQNRYNLEANYPPGTINRYSQHTLRLPYGGIRYQPSVLGMYATIGPLSENIRLLRPNTDISTSVPTYFVSAGLVFDFSWH